MVGGKTVESECLTHDKPQCFIMCSRVCTNLASFFSFGILVMNLATSIQLRIEQEGIKDKTMHKFKKNVVIGSYLGRPTLQTYILLKIVEFF